MYILSYNIKRWQYIVVRAIVQHCFLQVIPLNILAIETHTILHKYYCHHHVITVSACYTRQENELFGSIVTLFQMDSRYNPTHM